MEGRIETERQWERTAVHSDYAGIPRQQFTQCAASAAKIQNEALAAHFPLYVRILHAPQQMRKARHSFDCFFQRLADAINSFPNSRGLTMPGRSTAYKIRSAVYQICRRTQ